MKTLSVVITNFNEAENLRGALQSVAFTDEVIVVDGGSTDNSLEVAKKFGAKVFVRDNPAQLNINKNFGFEQAKGDWILSLDTDERIPSELAQEIRKVIEDPNAADGYFIKRRNFMGKKWVKYGGRWPDPVLRLFKKGQGKFACKHVHEMLEVDGHTGELDNPMDHIAFRSIVEYLSKTFLRYAPFTASKIKSGELKRRFPFIRWVLINPVELFFRTYLQKKGFLDGWEGLIFALGTALEPTVGYFLSFFNGSPGNGSREKA